MFPLNKQYVIGQIRTLNVYSTTTVILASEIHQDYSKKLTNSIKSTKKVEKINNSKNQFKSKYAAQKSVRRMPFYVSTAFKSASLKSMVETKALVKNTIKSLRDIDLDFRRVFLENQPDLRENVNECLTDDKRFPLFSEEASYCRKTTTPENSASNILNSRKGFYNEGLANVCKLYKKKRGSFYDTGRTPYDRFFSDMNNSRLNFEYRKHSGIRILLRGDLLGALNCFFPQLRLVPSEANPKKPILNKNFSNYSHTYKELEESFSLARKIRKELSQQASNNHPNNFNKEKQTIESSVESFVEELENCEFKKEKESRKYRNSINNKKAMGLNPKGPTLYELKPTRANTSLKSANLKDIPISVKHKEPTFYVQEEKFTQLGFCSKSEPQLNKKESGKEPMKNIYLNTKNSMESKKKTATSTDFCIPKENMFTYPDNSYCFNSNLPDENIYPDRLEDLHVLEGVVHELNAFINKNSSSKPLNVKRNSERCTYSSVLKNSFISDEKKLFSDCFEEKIETDVFRDNVKQNINKLEVNTTLRTGDNKISKPKVVYNEKEFERDLTENIKRILAEDPIKSEAFYKSSSPPSESYAVQPNIYKDPIKMEYQTTTKNQLISQISQTPQPAAMQSGFISSKRVPTMYEVEAFNKFLQQKFHSQNMNRLNQNFGNLLSKISVPQKSSSTFSQIPQFSVGPQIYAVEHGNKGDLRNSQHFQVLQNQGSTTPQANSSFCAQLNREIIRTSMIGNSSKVNVRTIISASELEKQAIEQYRQSEESLNSRYDVLEREAEEQYNNYNGHK